MKIASDMVPSATPTRPRAPSEKMGGDSLLARHHHHHTSSPFKAELTALRELRTNFNLYFSNLQRVGSRLVVYISADSGGG